MDPNFDDRSYCLWKGEKVLAACPTLTAHDAARRLLTPGAYGDLKKIDIEAKKGA